MLNFFRQFTKSRYGLIVVFVFLAIIALAFAAGDITGVRQSGGLGGNVVAKVGGTKITDSEVTERIDRFIRNLQREGQNVTMEQFLAQGGLEMAIDQIIDSTALVEFSKDSGMRVSKKLIDSDIASNPNFFGIDGKFSQKSYEDLLSQNRISPAQFREGLTQERYSNWLINRATLGNEMPQGVVLPYASLLLERRTGVVGLVSTIAMDPGPDPDDKTLNAFYVSKRAAYMVPQRRVVRYAIVKPDALRAQSAPTPAEIEQAYKAAGARYAARESRTIRQLVVLDQATANRVAGELKAGKTIAAAAASAGLEPTTYANAEKADIARQTTPAIADQVFAAAQGATVGPIRSGGSWYVMQVEKVEQIAAKSLDQVRAELTDQLTQTKTAQALAALRQSLEDGVGDGKTFDEVVRDAKLTALRTPALTASATNPDDANFKPDLDAAAVMRAGFTMENPGDEPQIVAAGPDGAFAIVGLEQIVQAAPRPLASIRDQVKRDYLVAKALEKARAAATAVVAKLEKGVPMQQALAEAGVQKGPPPKPFDFKRQEILGKQMAPYIQMAFQMAPHKAKTVEGQNREGVYIVYLDKIEEHSAASDPIAVARVKADIAPQVGPEYASQLIKAIRASVKVQRNEAEIAKLRASLSRTGTAAR